MKKYSNIDLIDSKLRMYIPEDVRSRFQTIVYLYSHDSDCLSNFIIDFFAESDSRALRYIPNSCDFSQLSPPVNEALQSILTNTFQSPIYSKQQKKIIEILEMNLLNSKHYKAF